MRDTIVTHTQHVTTTTNLVPLILVVIGVVLVGVVLVWRGRRRADVQPPNDR